MKKIFLLLLIVSFTFLVVNSGYSQDKKESSSFKIGIQFAPGLAWMKANSSNLSSNGAKFGFLYGMLVDYYFSANYGISTGVNVMYNGGKIQYNNLDPIKNSKYKLQYIEIPITLKMKTKEYGYMSYYAQFGAGGSINIKAKEDFTLINPPARYPYPITGSNVDVTNKEINMFRASFIVGGGLEYSLTGNTKALFGVTFNNGVTNIVKGKPNKAINNFLCVNLGIIF